MLDRTDNALRAASKALRDVVLPAVDPAAPHAREQAKLAADLLEHLRWQLARQSQRDEAELVAYTLLARAVAQELRGRNRASSNALSQALAEAEPLVRSCAWGRRDDVQAAVQQLREAVSVAVLEAQSADASQRDAVESAVLAGSHRLVELDRAWYAPFGLDPAPAEVSSWDDIVKEIRAEGQAC